MLPYGAGNVLLTILFCVHSTAGLPQKAALEERNWSYDLNKDAGMTVTIYNDDNCANTPVDVHLVWGGNMANPDAYQSFKLSRTLAMGWGDPRGLEQLDFSYGNREGVYDGCGTFSEAVGGYSGTGSWPSAGDCQKLKQPVTCMSLRKYNPPAGSTVSD